MTLLDDVQPPVSPTEARFLRHVLDRLRRLESRTRGSYAEVLVVDHLPGAELADHAVSPHDVEWDRHTIAVRTTGSRNSDHTDEQAPYAGSWMFKPVYGWGDGDWIGQNRRKCWADVAVLAFHDGFDLNNGWSFYVVSARQLEHDLPQRMTPRSLTSRSIIPVVGADLPRAVRAAVDEGRE